MGVKLYDCFKHWLNGGQVYFYSDPHFNDGEMQYLRKNYIGDDEQVRAINSKIGKHDTLVILGDVGDIEYVKKLRGYKVLVTGNHDAGSANYRRVSYTVEIPCDKYQTMPPNEMWLKATKLFPGDENQQAEYVDGLIEQARLRAVADLKTDPDFVRLSKSTSYNVHAPFNTWTAYYDNRLFDEVYDGILMISPKILLSHEPLHIPCAYNIHGHDHANWFVGDLHYNMCAEHINYTPISLKDLTAAGIFKDVPDIHRTTIDRAVAKKAEKIERK